MGTWPQLWTVKQETIWKKWFLLLVNIIQDTCDAWDWRHNGHWPENVKDTADDVTGSTYLEMPYLLLKIVNLYSLKLAFWLLAARNNLKTLSTFRRHFIVLSEDTFIKVQFSCSVVSDSLQSHEPQHARPPCPSPTPRVYQNTWHRVGDAIQPSHPLSPFPPALNLSQLQGLFQWVSSSHQVAKVLEFQLQHLSFQ